MKKIWNWNVCAGGLLVVQIVLAAVTWHAFSAGTGSVVLDIVGILALCLVFICPFLIFGNRNTASLFRLTTIYFAFMPAISVDTIYRLFKGQAALRVQFDVEQDLIVLSELPKEIIVLLLITYVICKKKGVDIEKRYVPLLVIAGFLGVLMLILPDLSMILLYWVSFFFVIAAYAFLEKVYAVKSACYENIILGLLIAMFFARGCYKMLAILQMYPLI